MRSIIRSFTKSASKPLNQWKKSYHVIGIGGSGTTPDEGIRAPLVYIENGNDVNLADIKGKICLITGPTMPRKLKPWLKKVLWALSLSTEHSMMKIL